MKRIRIEILVLSLALLIASGLHSSFFAQTAIKSQGSAQGVAVANSLLKVSLPAKEGGVRFGIIGDTGTGSSKQHQVANVFLQYHNAFPFDIVLMMGDNMYGGEGPKDYKAKFEDVYRPLLVNKV